MKATIAFAVAFALLSAVVSAQSGAPALNATEEFVMKPCVYTSEFVPEGIVLGPMNASNGSAIIAARVKMLMEIDGFKEYFALHNITGSFVVSKVADYYYIVYPSKAKGITVYSENLVPYGDVIGRVKVGVHVMGYNKKGKKVKQTWQWSGIERHYRETCTIAVGDIPKPHAPKPVILPPEPEPIPEPEPVVWEPNGIRDGNETDVDCGGTEAPACAGGLMCLQDSDCGSECNHWKTPHWNCVKWKWGHCIDWEVEYSWSHHWHYGAFYEPVGRCENLEVY